MKSWSCNTFLNYCMKILLQRVKSAQVHVDKELIGTISQGLLALVAIEDQDTTNVLRKMAEKLLAYRVFADPQGKMNLSLKDIQGELLLVSQFTLAANTNKGLRPSFNGAASPSKAKQDFEQFVSICKASGLKVETGLFAADMQVSLVNDGPVTFLLEA